MNTASSWNNPDHHDEDLSALLQTNATFQTKSNHPLERLRRNLRYNIIMAIGICILYIVLLITFQSRWIQAGLLIVLAFTVWATLAAFRAYKGINTEVNAGESLLENMKTQVASISWWLNAQEQVALFIYPISLATGFLLGGVIGSGKTVEQLMTKPIIPIALVITMAILVPVCHQLARWMGKKAFGKHIDALKENIRALEEEK